MKLFALALLLSCSAHASEGPLAKDLNAVTNSSKADANSKKIMNDSLEKLRKERLTQRAKKAGDTLPSFQLSSSDGKNLSSAELLKKGPLVITFYRGSWCPYCNIQLSEYEKHLTEWRNLGAEVVALSPELPELTAAFAVKRNLTFPLLFDKDNAFAEKLGLFYGIPADLKELYGKFGLDLAKTQGNTRWRLPIAATYVVSKDGKITYAYLDVDYKKRAEPTDIASALKKLAK
jgi:peroxiredoxin